MADILAFNLTQIETHIGTFAPRKMNDPDLSTKLKLMGVDVASFGDFFADKRMRDKMESGTKAKAGINAPAPLEQHNGASAKHASPDTRKQRQRLERPDEPIKCLTYKDPFANVYKKYGLASLSKSSLRGIPAIVICLSLSFHLHGLVGTFSALTGNTFLVE